MSSLLVPALAFAAAASALIACKKSTAADDAAALFCGTYTAAPSVAVEPARMYISSSVITDTALIGAFVRRIPVPGPPAVPAFQLVGSTGAFPYPDRPRIAFSGSGGTLELVAGSFLSFDLLSQSATGALLVRRDSVTSISSTGTSCPALARGALRKYSDSLCGPDRPGLMACRFRAVVPLEIDRGVLYLPLVSVAARNGDGCVGTYSNVFNYLEPAMLPQLGANDTLVVQRKRAGLVRQ
ncbi:hypothetical protein EPD60_05215 [Flaviaesturariibacter flavus]|uniref:Lipoprotein n=1 Tax=Flaviaesturariibacter flavus TaxID=2502780 RepID=A0A4R1BJM8_9BACT|nr:hypothetical protein [Flaviaesturariibacter flavus]TCJ17595.1 hypothetical protein EPD60_05215 [Flaviaesturariibacter flavus]